MAFWSHGPTQGLEFQDGDIKLQFNAHLISPRGQPSGKTHGRHPLLIYFAGMGSNGGLKDLNLEKLSEHIPMPVVVAAPLRAKGTWWMLDKDTEWGFVDGTYMPDMTMSYVKWIQYLTTQDTIDADYVSLL
jgi:hypothetical protein